MELTVDGRRCDLGGQRIVVPGYDAAVLADVEAARTGRSLRITIPVSPANDAVVCFARDPHTAARFNAAPHTATLRAEGATMLDGTVRLLEASDDGYLLEIRDGGAPWARNAALSMFNTLDIDYRATLTPETILASWTDDRPVRFFPIVRDRYPQQNASSDLLPAERLLTVDDYHPFLHIATLVRAIFAKTGYRVESRFMDSELFRSLYMSGAYASRDTTAPAARMGFCARRLGPVSAQADFAGRVTANPRAIANTVGNFVDTATPQSVDADGVPIADLYNNGACFGSDNGKIVFRPATEVRVGFEYYIRYTTDHRILSRERLAGFDTVGLDENTRMQFALANRYADRRNGISPGHTYLAIVFDHTAGARYRLVYTRHGISGALWTEFSARTAYVATPTTGTVDAPVLQVHSAGSWIPCAKDWALYDGYLAETGRTTVELRIRTPAERLTHASPKYFDRMFFQGADRGMSLTLHKECSLRAHFRSTPAYGSVLSFGDVAQHRIRQIELLKALQHLFNLRFHTEEATRTVRIEPADDFFGAGTEADWRAKSDFSQPVVLADIAPEVHELRTWGYAATDGVVARFDADAEGPLGQWSARIDSFAAMQGEQQLTNPLFCPTVNTTGAYANAPAASLMTVGDRDDATSDATQFTPRIVCFAGMHPLPEGQRWGYPATKAAYPLAAFHFAGDDTTPAFSLCFEDRDGVRGLHRHYDRQVALEAASQRITLSLQLAPHEFEALFTPGTGAPDLRSVFVLDTGCEPVRALLRRIEHYDPEAASVRCTFTKIE